MSYKPGFELEEDGSKHSSESRDSIIEAVARIVGSIQKALGPNAEVVLHDLENLNTGIIAIAGNLTSRRVGSPPTDLLLGLVKAARTKGDLINYRTQAPNGRRLRSSTLFLHNDCGRAIGCLCFNFDISHTVALVELLENELGVRSRHLWDEAAIEGLFQQNVNETFAQNIEDTFQKAIDDAVRSSGRSVKTFTKEDRVKIIRSLDTRGLFLIKNSATIVAERLCVSRASVYNYINRVRGDV